MEQWFVVRRWGRNPPRSSRFVRIMPQAVMPDSVPASPFSSASKQSSATPSPKGTPPKTPNSFSKMYISAKRKLRDR